MKLTNALAIALLLTGSATAQADFFGTLSGRSANPANNPQQSIEASLTFSGDYRNIGARYNQTLNENLSVYGDFGLSEVIGPDGTSFGGGVFYYLPNLSNTATLLNSLDLAVQANFHTASLDFLDVTAFGVAMLLSPKNTFNPEIGLNWYANIGLTRLAFDFENVNGINFFNGSSSEIELQVGGGVYMPMGPGTFYAGADLLDEFIIGAGYRYGF